ncbi:MAG: glycerophosphodiester phosphodiesterase [Spirochaetes bacterium]|jgi:glycerophosphoryl diester phosphodiesterase|nr:glycerophosphodiester phosphodiesterase [Spirochaetota bacterium]
MVRRVSLVLSIVIIVFAAAAALMRVAAAPSAGRAAAERLGIAYPAVIAHRGASYLAPEATAPAYILARDLGADFLEMDVQRTSDGVLIAYHDDTFERTTDVAERFPSRAKNPVADFTLAEVKSLDAGSWFNARFPDRARPSYRGLRVLTLDEVVAIASAARRTLGLYIESKNPEAYPGIEHEIIKALAARGWLDPRKVIFQSFSRDSLEAFAKAAPAVPRTYLVDEKMEKETGWKGLVAAAAEIGTGIGPVGYVAFPWNLGRAHREGLVVHVYTVNAPWQFSVLNFFGADGFFSDRCDLLMEYYGRKPAAAAVDILEKFKY